MIEKFVKLVRNFDPYEFMDNFDSIEEAEEIAAKHYRNKNIDWFIGIIEDIIDSSEQPEEIEEAEDLLRQLENLAA